MQDNAIPIDDPGDVDDGAGEPQGSSSESTAITGAARDIQNASKAETIALERTDKDTDEQDEVAGQVTLAVKVRKKRSPTQRDVAAASEYSPRYSAPTRRPASKRPASFNPVAWVADGVSGAIEEARHNDLGLSEDFWTHLYAVRRESLLTARALLESLITRLESKGDEQEERKQRRERRGNVDIDF